MADLFSHVAIFKNLVIIILIIICNQEYTVILLNRAGQERARKGRAGQCRAGQGRAGQGRAVQCSAVQCSADQGSAVQCSAVQGTVFHCRYEGSDIRLKLAESEEKICVL